MAKVNSENDKESPSFDSRILLLSTTHFGLATPVLNIQREKTALELSDEVISSELSALDKVDKITVYNTSRSDLQCVQIEIKKKITDISCLDIKAEGLESFVAVPTDDSSASAFVMMKFSEIKDKYEIEVTFDAKKETATFGNLLKTDRLSFMFSQDGKIKFVRCDDRVIGADEFLQSFITYNKKQYNFENTDVSQLVMAGDGEGIRLRGEIHLPDEINSGSFTFDFFKTAFSDAVFVRTTVNYPYTAETTSISTENSALGRFSDMKWTQAVPFQITPILDGDISVIKRNFMDDISSFRTQSFPECDEKNDQIASFNHQLTGGLVGLYDEKGGLIVANSRQVLGSMAHCPMRLEKDKTVRMNPFGTYYGKQRHHFGRAKDQILDVYTLVAAQGKSIAPSYNGSSETAVLGLYPLSAKGLSDAEKAEICAFSDGAVVVTPENSDVAPFIKDNITVREGNADGIDEKDLKSPVMTGISGNLKNYITKGARAIGHIVITQLKANSDNK